MIIGIGNDLVNLRRLEKIWQRYPQRLPQRLLTQQEQQLMPVPALHYLAGRWAAKESLGKALGCGLRSPLSCRNISVISAPSGQPLFEFTDAVSHYFKTRRVKHCHLSISHDGDYALATVLVEAFP